MVKSKFALLSAASLFCAGLALAQAPETAAPPMMSHHSSDFAALHKSMCEDHAARAAARLAYVESRLELTAAQKPLFAKWRQAMLDGEAKLKSACLAGTPKNDGKMPSVLEHEAHEEAMLEARLDLLKGTRSSLQAFYDGLSDAQKRNFDEMVEKHMHAHHGMGGEDHTPMRHPQ